MKKLVLLILLFFAFNISAQKEANFWYFGNGAALDFNSGSPVPVSGSLLNTTEGCSSFSDINGNLIFYVGAPSANARNLTVWGKDNVPMPNGTNLKGDSSSSQSALTVPAPGRPNIYYLFTVGTAATGGSPGIPGFFFYEIDMFLNGGLGDINTIPGDATGAINLSDGKDTNWTEKVTAVRSTECDTFWVISLSGKTSTNGNNEFYAYKVNNSGVDISNPIISEISGFRTDDVRGYLKVSPDGTKLVAANMTSGTFIFDFDADTGAITNFNNSASLNRISINGTGYGAEFSISSNKLYISTGDSANSSLENLYQFDLTLPTFNDINNSRYTVHSYNNKRGALQLGPNAKIYWTSDGSSSISVINKPEELGTAVNYAHQSVSVGASITASQGLPPFISSLLLPIEIVDTDDNSVINNQDLEFCAGQNKRIESEPVVGTNATYEWTFDDGANANIIQTTKDLVLSNIVASDSGKYTLVVQLTDICANVIKFEATFNLKVNSSPTLNAIPVYEQCDFDNDPNDFIANFNLTTQESKIYSGSDPVTIDFFETTDTSFSLPLTKNDYRNSTSTNAINGNHTLIVRVTNNATNCAVTLEIELKVNPSGIDFYPDIYTCELDLNENIPDSRNSIGSANSFYNLDNKTIDIIVNSSGSLDKDTHDFSYFRTGKDATLQINEILAPYEDDIFNSGADLFVRISLKNSNACENVGQFNIIIQERPIPQGSADALLLCLNNPINIPQPITTDLDANTGFSGDTYTWYLNGRLLTNETSAILKANKEGDYRVVASRFYMNNIANSADDFACTGYNMFTVLESNVARIETFSFVEDENNSENNTFIVMAIGEGDYEFALRNDDKNTTTLFQDEPVFKNIEGGIYTIIIRDKNGCLPNTTLQVSALQFPRFFTPNGDGRNDTWAIKGANNTFYSRSSIRIFNRYGKLVAEPTLDGIGWDGTNNGRILPSDDYWYNIILTPADPSKPTINKIGNFSLLRR
jgi:gliding motility-associated-like protein